MLRPDPKSEYISAGLH